MSLDNSSKTRVLSKQYPDLLEEWDYEKNDSICDPEKVSCGSNFKVWWKCRCCGHSWNTSIYVRTRGHGCPICARNKARESISKGKVHLGENDLGTRAPFLLESESSHISKSNSFKMNRMF